MFRKLFPYFPVQVGLSWTHCHLAMDLTDAVDLQEASQKFNGEDVDEQSENLTELNVALRLMNLSVSGSHFYHSDSSCDKAN